MTTPLKSTPVETKACLMNIRDHAAKHLRSCEDRIAELNEALARAERACRDAQYAYDVAEDELITAYPETF